VPGQVELLGGDTFARTLRAFGDELQDLADADAAAGAAVAALASQRARRRTGALASSFGVRVADAGVQISSPLHYASPQEYGVPSHNISPSLALTGALDQSADQVETIYAGAIDDALSHVRGK
jgi:Bacteriophage HK97-gp10, putative tail-component